MKSIIIAFSFLFTISGVARALASEQSQIRSSFQDTIQIRITESIDIFNTDELLNITFIFNMRDLARGKRDPEYIDATMIVHLHENDSIKQDLRIRARGNYRRSVCAFPPIMINPGRTDSVAQIITDNRNIKLVTHCRNNIYYENYVLKEYLIYKLYNLLTDYSFRVRLAKINYVDDTDPEDVISRYGFLIENIENLADRNNAIVFNNELLRQKDMIPLVMANLSVFEYMIGNFDWQLGKPHNMETIKALDILTDKAIPIPYDFDFSGFVDAPYAIPREDLGQKTIEQRVYLGICSHQEYWNDVLNTFEDLKDDFYMLVSSFEFLDNKNKQQVIDYLDQFYLLVQDRDSMLRRMRNECRQGENIINIVR